MSETASPPASPRPEPPAAAASPPDRVSRIASLGATGDDVPSPPPVPPADAPYKDFCDKGGRFGPHNTNQELHNPAVQKVGNLMFVSWFNAGVRVFDISDPRLVKEVGYYVPPERPGQKEQSGAHASPVNWSEEISIDTRGNIYLNEDKWGTFVLRYTGKEPKPYNPPAAPAAK